MENNSSKHAAFWANLKIGYKIALLITVVTLLIVVVSIVVNFCVTSSSNTEQIGEELSQVGNEVILRAADSVFSEIRILETLARTPSLVEMVKQANTDRANWSQKDISSLDKAWIDQKTSIEDTVTKIENNQLSAYFQEFIAHNPNDIEVFATDQKGMIIAMTDRTSDFLQSDEGWWESTYAGGKGNPFIDNVEYDDSTQTFAMNLGAPIIDPETQEVIGVLRGTLDISMLIQTLADVKIGETGQAFLLDEQNNILYSHDAEQIMQTAPENIAALFASGENGWSKMESLDGKDSVVAYSLLSGEEGEKLNWRILITQDISEVRKQILKASNACLLASLVAALIGIWLSTFVIRSIVKPIQRIALTFDKVATGDLELSEQDQVYLNHIKMQTDEVGEMCLASTTLLDYLREMAQVAQQIAKGNLSVFVKSRSEKDQLGLAFSAMATELRTLIGNVAQSANNLSDAAEQLSMTANQADQATNQIAVTIQQVARGTQDQTTAVSKTAASVELMASAINIVEKGAQEQSNSISKAAHITEQINNTIRQVAENVKEVTDGTNAASEAARKGAKIVEQTLSGMQNIKAKVGVSAEKVHEMGKCSEEIDAIVETIEDLASQTNLLALNAAIEAARAGDHGKGFAVVADEIRKLAERSAVQTKEIGDLIRRIIRTVSEAVKAMEEGSSEVESGVESANYAGSALADILVASESVNKQAALAAQASNHMKQASEELVIAVDSVMTVVEQNTTSTNQMTISSAEVTNAIENIASVSEENSAATEEVSASAEEMSAQVQEMSASAQLLSDMAQNLKLAVDRFIL